MNEEEIITTICDAIQDRLGDANVSRNFLTQTLLPQVNVKSKSEEVSKKSGKYIFRFHLRLLPTFSEVCSSANYLFADLCSSKALRIRSSTKR